MTARKSNIKSKDFYVYIHRKATTGDVFYVGKGCGDRSYSKHGRNKYWNRVVKRHGYKVEFYAIGLQEWYAFELEKELIAYYGRINLTNGTDGGDGTSGFFPSDETRKKLSIARSGEKNHQYGKPHSEETKRKISESKKGISPKVDYETRRRILEKLHSKEARMKSSIKKKGVPHSESHRINLTKSIIENVAKKVIRSDGAVFDSMSSATISIGKKDPSNISKCCRGKQSTAYGYGWKYA